MHAQPAAGACRLSVNLLKPHAQLAGIHAGHEAKPPALGLGVCAPFLHGFVERIEGGIKFVKGAFEKLVGDKEARLYILALDGISGLSGQYDYLADNVGSRKVVAIGLCVILVKILHLKARWIILGAIAVAVSAFLANVFIPDAKLAPLVPMIVSVAVLAIVLLCDKNNEFFI